MNTTYPSDEDLVHRLPLPLAQLYRRAHNAKTPLERHLTAYYLWEAALKLLASVAVIEYAERSEHDPQVAERLMNLARPSLGHWWEFVRRLVPVLADGGDTEFGKVRDLVLGRARDDLPRSAGLDAALRETLEGKGGARSTVRLTELFDRLVQYRNRELGHGAAGRRPAEFYERMGQTLLVGIAELLGRVDVLVGRQFVYLADVRRLASGSWLIERLELRGETGRRIESQQLPESETAALPRPERPYLVSGQRCLALHPLLVFDTAAEEVLFLNARRGKQRTEYLSYTTGRVLDRPDLGGEQRALLARVLGMSVGEAEVQQWAARSQAEEPTADSEEHSPARQIGEFELLSEVGRGGMGVVYRAWQPSLGRQVALKCLLRAGDPKAAARFAREIHALGRIEHPHIIKVFTSGAEGEQWFYAMELVEGTTPAALCDKLQSQTTSAAAINLHTWQQTLDSVCEEARQAEKTLSERGASRDETPLAARAVPLPPRSYIRHIAELIRQVAEAAHALHETGVIHRDIKPGNIMIHADGTQAILMDLGLAQLADDVEGRLTRTRQFVGTLRYASPEQVLAAGSLDRRSDVYSLGATLWELLTLRPLYGAGEQTPTPELMQRIQYEEPERLRKHHPGIPRDLEAIVLKCLEKNPARRYATAQEVAADLGRFLANEPVQARPSGAWDRLQKWARRRPAIAALSATSLMLAVLGFGLVTWKWLEAEAARRQAESARQAEENARQTAEAAQQAEAGAHQQALAALQQARVNFYFSNIALAQREWAAGNAVASEELLDACPPELRAWEWHYLKGRCHRDLLTFRADTSIGYVAFSPDGRQLATGGGELMQPNVPGIVKVWDAATGDLLYSLAGHSGPVNSVAFNPDGKHLASASLRHDVAAVFKGEVRPATGEIKLWDLETEEELFALPGHGSVAFSPDGKRLAGCGANSSITIWDAATGEQRMSLSGHVGRVGFVTFSPDGMRLASTANQETLQGDKGAFRFQGEVKTWNLTTGNPELTLRGHSASITTVAFHPDGKRLVSGSSDQTVKVWDLDSGKELLTLRGHTNDIVEVAFSPDGKWLASAGVDQAVKVWDMDRGQELLTLRGHTGAVSGVAFDPKAGGQAPRLASAGKDGLVKVWDVLAGQDALDLWGHSFRVASVAFSPDSRRLASSSADRTVQVWDLTTRQKVFRLSCQLSRVLFSPDGQFLVTAGGNGFRRNQPGELKIWSAKDGRPLHDLKGHSKFIMSAAFRPDGRHLAAASGGDEPGEICIWDVASGTEVRQLERPTSLVGDMAYSPDGRHLAVTHLDGTLRIYDADSGQPIQTLRGHGHAVASVAYSPDGRRLASGDTGGVVIFWDGDTGQELLRVRAHAGMVNGLAFSPEGRRLASAGYHLTSGTGEVKVWDPELGREALALPGLTIVAFSPDGRRIASAGAGNLLIASLVKVWDGTPGAERLNFHSHGGEAFGLAVRPDGQQLASGQRDNTIQLWDRTTAQRTRTLHGHAGPVMGVAYHPDGRRLASSSTDRTVRIWDLQSGKELWTLKGHTASIFRVAYSPDGQRLASASNDQTVRIWDANTGAEQAILRGHTDMVYGVAYHPDGKCLATCGKDRTVRLWDTASGRELRSLGGASSSFVFVAFSADGRCLAAASLDGTVKLWDLVNSRELFTFRGHRTRVNCVAFSPDGRQLASAGDDRTVQVWNAATGRVLASFRGHLDPVRMVVFSPDGRSLITASEDQTVKVWDLPAW